MTRLANIDGGYRYVPLFGNLKANWWLLQNEVIFEHDGRVQSIVGMTVFPWDFQDITSTGRIWSIQISIIRWEPKGEFMRAYKSIGGRYRMTR